KSLRPPRTTPAPARCASTVGCRRMRKPRSTCSASQPCTIATARRCKRDRSFAVLPGGAESPPPQEPASAAMTFARLRETPQRHRANRFLCAGRAWCGALGEDEFDLERDARAQAVETYARPR